MNGIGNVKIIMNIKNIKEKEHKETFGKCLLEEVVESLFEGLIVLVIKFFMFLIKSIFD